MQLYVLILNDEQYMRDLLHELMDAGIQGATIYESKGAVQYFGHDSVEPPTMFGSLRQYLHPNSECNQTLLTVLEDSQVATVKEIVKKVTGGLDQPDVGIAFTVPLSSVDGFVR